jgi:uncharacterized membrane protein SpoIIM required for sporulation
VDLNSFLRQRRPGWEALEALLREVDRVGMRGLSLEQARELAARYRAASEDLVKARGMTANAEILEYLNGLVGRAYGHIYATRGFSWRGLWSFWARGYPRLVRSEWRVIALATGIFLAGALFGAGAMVVDPDAGAWLLPKDHLKLDPSDRVAALQQDMADGEALSPDQQAYFSSFLFTHNIQVTFLAFALGLSFGAGTFVVLFANGLFIGSLAANYHFDGVGTFFYAWILPHGVPELTSIFVAGGAGLILGRALWNPGRRTRGASLRLHAGRAVKLVLGTAPVLVVAGIIEGTISQLHPPLLSYGVKLGFAGLMAALLASWLGLAGRRR